MVLTQLLFFFFDGAASAVDAPAPVVVSRAGGVRRHGYLRRHIKGYDPEPEQEVVVVKAKKRKKLKIPKVEIEAINDGLGEHGPVVAKELDYEVRIGPKPGEHALREIDDDEEFLLMSVLQ